MKKVLIIAEAGVNYNGDIKLAKEMIKVAADAGADIIKFQTGIPEKVISKFAVKADYQKINTGNNKESQLDMARRLMLSWDVYPELIKCCEENNICFLSTPFDVSSARFLHDLGMQMWKIPSGEITNLPLLLQISKYGEPVIMSTGMSTLNEIETAVTVLRENGISNIILLQCNTEYPTPYEDANISVMLSLKNKFNVEVGYSDHTMGMEVPIAAVALGACVIEKHFTLDKTMNGPDHAASVEPCELKEMIQAIRHIEIALGDGIKKPSRSEVKNINVARKSIVAQKKIRAGEILTEDNIACKRPGGGISPMKWFDLLGTTAIRDFEEDEMIEI